jgi:hypothetical protein
MACLTDLVNLNLSDTTEKIIAEYIWYGNVFFPPCYNLHAAPSAASSVGKNRSCWLFRRPPFYGVPASGKGKRALDARRV